ncbi:hypothetical protein [Rufibacter radiotolerans]|uniref:hypothetical protein n=1 Tax=Rufibacter radiotolerans TaxID=1379910 RepID=UPI0012E23E56|nr:hypothetical protein [Rufibacter radiotolerans]
MARSTNTSEELAKKALHIVQDKPAVGLPDHFHYCALYLFDVFLGGHSFPDHRKHFEPLIVPDSAIDGIKRVGKMSEGSLPYAVSSLNHEKVFR